MDVGAARISGGLVYWPSLDQSVHRHGALHVENDTLRPNVTFSNGQPFTAEDVKYSFDWLLDPANRAARRPIFAHQGGHGRRPAACSFHADRALFALARLPHQMHGHLPEGLA